MGTVKKLSDEELRTRIAGIPSWQLRENQLFRSFEFPDFVSAFAFMTSVALIAERLGHHPNWTNVYNRVEISLSTHDVDGVSDNDLLFAAKIDEVVRGNSS